MQTAYLETVSGKLIDVLNPDPDMFDIDDIAHGLTMQSRFAGQVRRKLSIAEHSVNVSYLVPPEDAFQGLMHDATEYLLVDVPTPVKRILAGYYEIEDRLWRAIAAKFNINPEMSAAVKEADARICLTEKIALVGEQNLDSPGWVGLSSRFEPYDDFHISLEPVDFLVMKNRFLRRFEELSGQ